MLRKRSRTVASKQQGVIGDNNHQWLPQPNEKPTTTSSFFLTSPRFLKGFFTCSQKLDQMMSPTSILEKNPFSAVANFWVFDNNSKFSSNKPNNNTNTNTNNQKSPNQHDWEQPSNKKGIGLALIDENNNGFSSNQANKSEIKQQKRKLVVFGSQLRIQVPSSLTNSSVFPCFSPESPREFGIKTPRNNNNNNNNLSNFSNSNSNSQVHPEEKIPSMGEIDEESEDYTCVISHGPNPKTTHIFGDCIVESCCGKIVGSPSFTSKRNGFFSSSSSSSLGNSIPSSHENFNFLSFCHYCKKKLGEGRDIYMYRGEKGFCSEECRCQEMLFDEVEN